MAAKRSVFSLPNRQSKQSSNHPQGCQRGFGVIFRASGSECPLQMTSQCNGTEGGGTPEDGLAIYGVAAGKADAKAAAPACFTFRRTS